MCPACYINGLLFLIFGATGAAVANNIWVISISVLLTIAGVWYMWKAYKINQGQGGLRKNLQTTVIYIFIFAAGYVTAAYMTHDYFKLKNDTQFKSK